VQPVDVPKESTLGGRAALYASHLMVRTQKALPFGDI
jgi:hypothetical protein